MEYEYIKHKLPPNFVNKPGTVILVDNKGEPWYKQNDDGTCSGFDNSNLGTSDPKADSILRLLKKAQK